MMSTAIRFEYEHVFDHDVGPAKAVQVNLNLVAQPETLDDEAQGSFLSCLGKGIES